MLSRARYAPTMELREPSRLSSANLRESPSPSSPRLLSLFSSPWLVHGSMNRSTNPPTIRLECSEIAEAIGELGSEPRLIAIRRWLKEERMNVAFGYESSC